MTKVLFDTNYILANPESLLQYDAVLTSHVLREIESLERKKGDHKLQYDIRKAKRIIEEHKDSITYDLSDSIDVEDGFDEDYVDNKLLSLCLAKGYKMLTNDLLLRQKCRLYGVELVEDNQTEKERYNGYVEISMSQNELNDVYQSLHINQWGLLENQYLIIRDSYTEEISDCFKWKNNSLQRVQEKGFKTNQFGKFSPYDHYQQCAVDSILSNQITTIKGNAGSGKSLISLYTSWHLMEKFKYDKLIIFTNPTKTRDAQELGFYKGTRTEKLLDSQIGIMLSSKIGDPMELELLINQGRIELLPFSDIRGFDTTSEQKTIVWITESQNLNTDLLKLGLQRIGLNTKVIVDGDPFAQVDKDIYKTDNGILRMSEVFRGTHLYGEVTLNKIYRSEIAEIAERM